MTDTIKQGNELLKQRVCLRLYFDVFVHDGKIVNSGDDDEVKRNELALLKQFLVADPNMLREMLIYQVALELGMQSPEDFEDQLLGTLMEAQYEQRMFGPAISQLQGEEGAYWREIRDSQPIKGYGNALGFCVEGIFECFDAHYVKGETEIIEEEEK